MHSIKVPFSGKKKKKKSQFNAYESASGANDICKESKRQTINADDVLKALEEIEFPEFIEPLKAALDEFRQRNAGKKAGSAKAKGVDKKRKMDETSTQNGNGDGKDEEEEKEEEEEEEEEANDDRSSLPDND